MKNNTQALQDQVLSLTEQNAQLRMELSIQTTKLQRIIETIFKYTKLGTVDEILNRNLKGWLAWAIFNIKDLSQMVKEIIQIIKS
jgi:hypothetical protein